MEYEIANTPLYHLWSLGWSVIPCWRRRDDSAKRPRVAWRIYQTRRPTEEEICSWLIEHPVMNVAVVTGAVSGIIVVDCDSDNAVATIEPMLSMATITTQSARGRHYYFQHPGGNLRSAHEILPGVDLRGDGGYVLAPDSLHPSGVEYTWIVPPWERAPAPLPAALRDALDAYQQRRGQNVATPVPPVLSAAGVGGSLRRGRPILQSEADRLRSIPLPPGHRKQQAMSASAYRMGQLIPAGYLTADHVREVFLDIWCNLWRKPRAQGEKTIAYALNSGITNPRLL